MTLLKNRSIISFRTATNFSIFSLFLIFGFTILSIFAPIFGSNATNNSTQELAAEVNPVISLSAPTELSFNINPTAAGVFDSKELKVNISTNAIKGYELYFSSEDEQTNMKHTTPSITQSISSTFTGSLTSTNMQNNTWGYSLNNTDFKSIPKKTEQVKLKDLNTYPIPAERTQSIYFGVKADTTLPSGTYEKNVIFTAIAHANPPRLRGIFTISNMQQMNPNICKASTTPLATAIQLDTDGSHHGDPNYVPTVTLTDTRDNNTYTVSKLADGKCWMTQNLRIINKTITPADSDVISNYTIPASSISGFNSFDTSSAYVDSYGGFYTWYAATAGTGTQAMSSGNTSVSICPKGWKLPTGGDNGEFKTLYNNYNSSSVLISNPVNLTFSGYARSSSRDDQGSAGYYWSSTARSGDGAAYVLFLGRASVQPATISSKHYGLSVRCIAEDEPRAIHDLANMQEMHSRICVNTTTPLKTATELDTDGSHHGDPNYVPTKTLTDTRDNNTYTVSKLADGRCWMTQNLRIVNKTITPADSDVTANYTIPASSISGFDSGAYEASNVYLDSDGGLYKWYTATAGTGTYYMSNTTVSICPKGWRLPTGGNSGEFQTLYNNYPSSSALRSDPVNLTLSGSVYNSSRYDQGSNGYYWSSTAHSNKGVYAYDLFLTASTVYPTYYDGKNGGRSVRCIAR